MGLFGAPQSTLPRRPVGVRLHWSKFHSSGRQTADQDERYVVFMIDDGFRLRHLRRMASCGCGVYGGSKHHRVITKPKKSAGWTRSRVVKVKVL